MKKMHIVLFIVALFAIGCCAIGCNGSVRTLVIKDDTEYTIDNDVEEVYIKGDDKDTEFSNVCIIVSKREKDLVINLENVSFRAKAERAAVFCENTTFNLTIRFSGQSTIIGGRGTSGDAGTSGLTAAPWNWYGRSGASGQCAISCGKVVFEKIDPNATLTLKGGRGGDGGDAGNGDIPLNINLVFDKPSGGNGGNGASALKCDKSSSDYKSVTCIAGGGGSGGKAGHCRIWALFLPIYGHDGSSGETPAAIEAR